MFKPFSIFKKTNTPSQNDIALDALRNELLAKEEQLSRKLNAAWISIKSMPTLQELLEAELKQPPNTTLCGSADSTADPLAAKPAQAESAAANVRQELP